jgi:hypothetical protein
VRSDSSRLGAALRNSRLRRVRDWLTRAESGAEDAAPGRVGTAIRSSWLYRWLTADPDPDVIVIDLRETRTVGPVIELLDRTIELATPYWRASRLHDGAVALARAGDRLAETRVGRVLARVFVPPEPAENDERPDQ